MDFEPFPKIPRLNREILVTEKLDGTNAAIIIEDYGPTADPRIAAAIADDPQQVIVDRHIYGIGAQSRNRLITPNNETNKQADNYGFAGWVADHAAELVRLLGPGRHFGEWWGQGIARNYGLDHKRFSLFNANRYDSAPFINNGLVHVVPVLYRGSFSELQIKLMVHNLRDFGSVAASGFDRPEGIIVYHTAARQSFKVTLEGDDAPKSASIHWGNDDL